MGNATRARQDKCPSPAAASASPNLWRQLQPLVQWSSFRVQLLVQLLRPDLKIMLQLLGRIKVW